MFNKAYLDLDLDFVLRKLHTDAPLQPPVEGSQYYVQYCEILMNMFVAENIAATPPFRPTHLAASYLRTANVHHEEVSRTLNSLRYQYQALRIACSALDLNVLSIQEAFEVVTTSASRELEKQESLLAGLDADLDIVQRVTIHKEFTSPSTRKALELGERGRTLGDYVSQVKMRQVAETCRRTHSACSTRSINCKAEPLARRSTGEDFTRLRIDGQATPGDRLRSRDTGQYKVSTETLGRALQHVFLIYISSLDEAEVYSKRSQEAYTMITNAAGALDSKCLVCTQKIRK